MRTRLLVLAASLSLMAVAGCSSGSQAVDLAVTCDEFGKQSTIEQSAKTSVGATVTIRLCSNQTTGYAWEEAIDISDPAVAQVANRTYEPPGTASPAIVGAAGSEVVTIDAVAAGTTTIAMSYSQPWEGGQKGAWTYTLTLTVK